MQTHRFTLSALACLGLGFSLLPSCDGGTSTPGPAKCADVSGEMQPTCEGLVNAIAQGDVETMIGRMKPDQELYADSCGKGECLQTFYDTPEVLRQMITAAGGFYAAYGLPADGSGAISVKETPAPRGRSRVTACVSDAGGQQRVCLESNTDAIISLSHWVPAMEPDSDGDLIDFTADKCPTIPEDYNGVNDEDGCTDAGAAALTMRKVSTSTIEITTTPGFEEGKLSKDGGRVIDAVHAVARTHKAKSVTTECLCPEGDDACKGVCTPQMTLVVTALKEAGEETVYAEVVSEAGARGGATPDMRFRLAL